MDKKTVDIGEYVGGFSVVAAGMTFSVWGGEGRRGRFALPIWRAIHLLAGERGGIVFLEDGRAEASPFFLLDLINEPACLDFDSGSLGALLGREAPAMAVDPVGEVSVLLGRNGSGSWFLKVWGADSVSALEGESRETLLFLAGECAGLLFFRELTEEGP